MTLISLPPCIKVSLQPLKHFKQSKQHKTPKMCYILGSCLVNLNETFYV